MTAALEAVGLGKRYGRRWALTDCTLSLPAGRVIGLVGPNGAGKTTLLHLAVGLLKPSSGEVTVLGQRPGDGPEALAGVGFLAQDSPAYSRLTVEQHLQMGTWLNPRWDGEWATARVRELGLDMSQRAGTLSGGQRAQLALTLAVAKRPELLLLDEPVASLDPLARREFLQTLMESKYADGRSLSILVPAAQADVLRDIQELMPYGLAVRDGAGLERLPTAYGWALVALDLHLAPRRELAVVGPPDAEIARAALARWDPRAVGRLRNVE